MRRLAIRLGALGRPKGESGQGLTEYCLILVLASIALVSALGVFGTNLSSQVDTIVDVVAGL